VMLGGALDPRFEPVAVQARVRMLGDGQYPTEYSGTTTDAGNTAVLEVGSITIIVTSRSVSLTDRSLFLAHGQDPQRYNLVVVKSPHTRYDYFEAWAAKNIGIHQRRPKELGAQEGAPPHLSFGPRRHFYAQGQTVWRMNGLNDKQAQKILHR
jgi:microcystin degradation protein MlrC